VSHSYLPRYARLRAFFFLLFAIALGGAAHAQDKPAPQSSAGTLPLWEFGMGLTVLDFPYYLGADQSRVLALPLPYFVYRGEYFRSDRDGVRGVLFDSHSLSLNLSASASPPVASSSSDARAGMPDLKPSVELGPALDWTLWRGTDPRNRLKIGVPVRAAFTIEAPPRFIGWTSDPRLNLDVVEPRVFPGWNFGVQVGPLLADRRQNEYYYSVAPQYATPTRHAYDAPGGFSGMEFTGAISKRFPRFWVGAYVRYDSISHAVFDSSPLVRSNYGLYGGVGIAWMITESTARVPRREDD